jgi:hypothetical protein
MYHYLYTVVGTDLAESDFSKVASATPLGTIDGDANGDGFVDVLDVTSIINYILENNPLPFLFSEADMNDDNQITVADMVGVINIIIGSSKMIKEGGGVYPVMGDILLKKDVISVNCPVSITILKIELSGEDPSNIEIIPLTSGFELVTRVESNRISCILFSLSGKDFSTGINEVLKIQDASHKLSGIKISGATKEGLSLRFNDYNRSFTLQHQLNLTINPNPISGVTNINIELVEDCHVNLILLDLNGKEITTIFNHQLNKGYHTLKWNFKASQTKTVTRGVYLIQATAMTIEPVNRSYQCTKKVLIK